MIDDDPRTQTKSEPGQNWARIHLGSFEFRKRGALRFDLRDPYHLAVALTWPQFLDDGPVTTYKDRQSFSELPGDRYGVSANASETQSSSQQKRERSDDSIRELTSKS